MWCDIEGLGRGGTAKQKLRHDSEIGAERVRNEASKGIECGNKWTPLPAGDWDSEGLVRVCVCELARRECVIRRRSWGGRRTDGAGKAGEQIDGVASGGWETGN